MLAQELPIPELDIIFDAVSALINIISAVVLVFIVEVLSMAWDYLVALISGEQFASPAVFLIALMLIVTAYLIVSRG